MTVSAAVGVGLADADGSHPLSRAEARRLQHERRVILAAGLVVIVALLVAAAVLLGIQIHQPPAGGVTGAPARAATVAGER
jgi:hypothetical protein